MGTADICKGILTGWPGMMIVGWALAVAGKEDMLVWSTGAWLLAIEVCMISGWLYVDTEGGLVYGMLVTIACAFEVIG